MWPGPLTVSEVRGRNTYYKGASSLKTVIKLCNEFLLTAVGFFFQNQTKVGIDKLFRNLQLTIIVIVKVMSLNFLD